MLLKERLGFPPISLQTVFPLLIKSVYLVIYQQSNQTVYKSTYERFIELISQSITSAGFWLFHCHVEMHAAMGMAMVFQVGEPSDFPSPPRNFQRCGNSGAPTGTYWNSAHQEVSLADLGTQG